MRLDCQILLKSPLPPLIYCLDPALNATSSLKKASNSANVARLLSGWGFTRSLNFNRKREAGRLKICLQVWDEFKSDGIPLLSWLLVTLELCSSEANLSGLFLSYFTVAKRRYTIQMCSNKCVHKTILLSKNYTYFNLRGYGLFRKKLSAPMGFVSIHSIESSLQKQDCLLAS